jgi:hypothetical protein
VIVCCVEKGAWVCEGAVSVQLRDIYTRIYRPLHSRITVVVKLETRINLQTARMGVEGEPNNGGEGRGRG